MSTIEVTDMTEGPVLPRPMDDENDCGYASVINGQSIVTRYSTHSVTVTGEDVPWLTLTEREQTWWLTVIGRIHVAECTFARLPTVVQSRIEHQFCPSGNVATFPDELYEAIAAALQSTVSS